MNSLTFSSENEAFQHLSDLTGKRVKIAVKGDIFKMGQKVMVGPYENGEYRKAIAIAQPSSGGVTVKFENGRIETREDKDIHRPETLNLKESVIEQQQNKKIPSAVRIPLNFFPGELK